MPNDPRATVPPSRRRTATGAPLLPATPATTATRRPSAGRDAHRADDFARRMAARLAELAGDLERERERLRSPDAPAADAAHLILDPEEAETLIGALRTAANLLTRLAGEACA